MFELLVLNSAGGGVTEPGPGGAEQGPVGDGEQAQEEGTGAPSRQTGLSYVPSRLVPYSRTEKCF